MRLHSLDALRGMAVIWMIIFHTAFDLKMFGYMSADFSKGFWYSFPRVIAFTFLFCVGASLHMAHHPKTNWTVLGKRALKLGGASFLVSLSTYLIFPRQWIFFGTLHCILVGSLLGGLFIGHRKLMGLVLLMILIAQYGLHYDIKWVASLYPNQSMDFIPIYPWFWAILSGMLMTPHLSRIRWINHLPPSPFLNFLGKHSLKIYLLHQPLIYGVIWAYTLLVS